MAFEEYEVIGQLVDGAKLVKAKVLGPASYSSPHFVRVKNVNRIRDVLGIKISGGYRIEVDDVTPVTGNVIVTKIYYQTGLSGNPQTEVADGYVLTGSYIRASVVGW